MATDHESKCAQQHAMADEMRESCASAAPCASTSTDWLCRCHDVLRFFASHKAAGTLRNSAFLDESLRLSLALFSKDGDFVTIDNHGSQELCDSYPMRLILSASQSSVSSLLERARFARVHRRFVAPVIFLAHNVCIARSSTLSSNKELLLHKATSVGAWALYALCSLLCAYTH